MGRKAEGFDGIMVNYEGPRSIMGGAFFVLPFQNFVDHRGLFLDSAGNQMGIPLRLRNAAVSQQVPEFIKSHLAGLR